jgi:pyroglutamyl-peptidase
MSDKKKSPVLLVTAFEPFDGAPTNASLILLEKLKQLDWEGRVVFFGPVPVSFEDAWPVVKREMDRYPDLQGVIALGQAEGRGRISLERLAVNWVDTRTPDNDNFVPKTGKLDQKGPEAIWSGFPWQEMEASPLWSRSYSAGSYVCNALMYRLLEWAEAENKTAGFVHVPLVKSQFGYGEFSVLVPYMDDEAAISGLCRIIDFSLDRLEPSATPKQAPVQKLRLPRPPAA